MPVPMTAAVADAIVAEATLSRGGALIYSELDIQEGSSWRYESDPITYVDAGPEDFVDLTGCTASARVTTKQDGALLLTLATVATTTGQVIATATPAQTATIAQPHRGDLSCWWECELVLPDGRKVWLWRSPIIVRQKGIA